MVMGASSIRTQPHFEFLIDRLSPMQLQIPQESSCSLFLGHMYEMIINIAAVLGLVLAQAENGSLRQ
jgi:hypothetical protein